MRYLIRGGKTPYEMIPTEDYLSKNIMGSNCGNFMYLHGIVRTLMTDSSVGFQSTHYKYNYSADEIKKLNNTIDGFIIPLADAFRDSFINELKGLTRLVKELNCPSYVIGVGVSAGAEQKFAEGSFGFEQEAKEFCDAVLEKSGQIGVRGAETGRFLELLGYKEGELFRVIGCPELYTFGRSLKIRDTAKTPDCNCAVNMSHAMAGREFSKNAAAQFRAPIYVPQLVAELQTLYWGTAYKDYLSGKECDPDDPLFPSSLRDPFYAEDRVRFFVNVNDWVDFMKQQDLVFGTRLHGNITAVIAGAPSILMTKDTRMRELAAFHGLTNVDVNDLPNYRDIWEIIESADFHSPERKQAENFDNFIDFLHVNGLKTIYDDDPYRTDAPMDELIEQNNVHNEIVSAVNISREETAERMLSCVDFLRQRRKEINARVSQKDGSIKKLRAEIADKKKTIAKRDETIAKRDETIAKRDKTIESKNGEIEKLKAKQARLEKILDCRSVKLSIKARNAVVPKGKRIKI